MRSFKIESISSNFACLIVDTERLLFRLQIRLARTPGQKEKEKVRRVLHLNHFHL